MAEQAPGAYPRSEQFGSVTRLRPPPTLPHGYLALSCNLHFGYGHLSGMWTSIWEVDTLSECPYPRSTSTSQMKVHIPNGGCAIMQDHAPSSSYQRLEVEGSVKKIRGGAGGDEEYIVCRVFEPREEGNRGTGRPFVFCSKAPPKTTRAVVVSIQLGTRICLL